ncbi:MAG: carboxypeptidase-like regulatory domain-containing protein [Planctomycetota bacterium]
MLPHTADSARRSPRAPWLLGLLAVGVGLSALLIWRTNSFATGGGSHPDTLPETAAQARHGGRNEEAVSGSADAEPTAGPSGQVRAAPLPTEDPAAPSADPDFDGRSAALRGRVHYGERGTRAEVVCVTGMNRGRVLVADTDGSFEAERLFPGVARFAVRVGGRLEADRQILLRAGIPCRLDLDLADRRTLRGSVTDAAGRPLTGASVACDGRTTTTGLDGSFALTDVVDAGQARVVCRHPGYAAQETTAWRTASAIIRLPPGGRLAIAIPPARSDSADVYVLPDPEAPGSFPWSRSSPLDARPGRQVEVEDLPAGTCSLLVLATDATAWATARVEPGTTTTVALSWRPLPRLTGTVCAAGECVPGARVSLRIVDELEAMTLALGDARVHQRTILFAPMPALRQSTVTDARGSFDLALPEFRRSRASIRVEVADRTPVQRPLRPGETHVAIELDH